MGRLFFLLIVGALLYGFWPKPTSYPDVWIEEAPVQKLIPAGRKWEYRGHTLQALAEYHLRALVLSSERYRYDRPAKIVPVDLALGWGPMARPATVRALNVYQSGRWYNYTWADQPPIPVREIIRHSANTHMIPADAAVEKTLLGIRAGDVIEADGLLVEAKGEDGWEVKSSLSRDDIEGGSCELMWLEKIKRLAPTEVARKPPK